MSTREKFTKSEKLGEEIIKHYAELFTKGVTERSIRSNIKNLINIDDSLVDEIVNTAKRRSANEITKGLKRGMTIYFTNSDLEHVPCRIETVTESFIMLELTWVDRKHFIAFNPDTKLATLDSKYVEESLGVI